jgi:hypothetical protein
MSRLRFLLAWLIMLAIPVQGLAAATMAFCVAEHQVAHAGHAPANADHDHSAHSHGTGSTAHAAADQSVLPDANHKCGVCASCCHGVALTQAHPWPELVPLERAGLIEPFVRIHPAPSARPDKPPRT